MPYTQEQYNAKMEELTKALEDPDFLEKHSTPETYIPVGLTTTEMLDAVLKDAVL